MSDDARAMTSPLGTVDQVARAKADHAPLAPVIDDLELVITPEFDSADRNAVETQRRLKSIRLVEMSGGAIVAVLAIVQLTVGGDDAWVRGLGVAAAATAAVTALAAGRGRSHSLDLWLDQRQIAEELRSLYFTALTSNELRDNPNRRRLVRAQVQQILKPEHELPDFEPDVAADPDQDRLDPTAWTLYRAARLHDQIEWMRGKAETVRARTGMLGRLQTALIVTSAVCAALTVLTASPWWAIPVAASAGLVSFLAAVDSVVASERLAQHYTRTLTRLELIDRSLDTDEGSRGDVEEIETVLMAEHRAWRRIAEGNQR